MLHLRIPVIVEGKYDKARLAQLIDGFILTTDGFAIFNQAEKRALITRLGQRGVILLCDSDGGGKVIRGYLKGILAPELVYDLYIPQVAGKEKRKAHRSRAGFLGVEGIDNRVLEELFARLAARHPEILAESAEKTPAEKQGAAEKPITKADLYFLGLTGGDNAAQRRDALCREIGFPAGMTATALLSALNLLYTKSNLEALCVRLNTQTGQEQPKAEDK